MVLLIASCVSFGGISLAMLIKTSSMHMQCAETFDSCLWRSAWPRKYSKESGTLGHFTCNEHLVERIDARFCDISRLATSFDTFESLVEVRGLNALPENLIRYLASPNCSVKVVELSGKLPNVLNFSGLGMRLLPSVLKATFENHRDDIVTTLDLSSNNFGKAAIEDILRALGCPKEDGVSSALCGYLESVDLSHNEMEEIPNKLLTRGIFPKLDVVDVFDNPLLLLEIDDGQRHIHFGSGATMNLSQVVQMTWLTSLRHFTYSMVAIRGSIPSQLGLLTELNTLSLTENRLTGSIPSQLGLLTELDTLSLTNTNLAGSIPSQLGQLTELDTLRSITL